MEYLYGSLEGRCSEAVCRPVRVLEIRIGHVSSFGLPKRRRQLVRFSFGDECGRPFLVLCIAFTGSRWCFGEGTQSPAIARLPEENNTCRRHFEGVLEGFRRNLVTKDSRE